MLTGVISVISAISVLLVQELFFKRKEKAKQIKKMAGYVIYNLDKVALKCAFISQDIDLFFQTKYEDEFGTNSYMGKIDWTIPDLNAVINESAIDLLDAEDVFSINEISLKTMVLQEDINFALIDLMEPEDATNNVWKSITFVGYKALNISNRLKKKYEFELKYSIDSEESINEMMKKYDKFINAKE